MVKQEALLKNWHFVWLEHDQSNVAVGYVYGHPRFTAGDFIHTSKIINYNVKNGIIETLHTYYKLEDYEYYEAAEECEFEGQASEGGSTVSKGTIPLRCRKQLGSER